MMFADNFGKLVSQRVEEIPVGRDDGAIHAEFDHGLGFADGVDLCQRIARLRRAQTKRHERPFLPEGKFWLDRPKLLGSSKNPPAWLQDFIGWIIIN
jgi:hypothetical protein